MPHQQPLLLPRRRFLERRPFNCLGNTKSIIRPKKQRGNRSTKSSSSRTDHGNKANTASDTAGPGQQQPAPQIFHQGSLPTPSAHLLEAISLLRTFKKYPDNMKNLPEEGGLPSPTKATKGTPPARTDRPYVVQIRALGTIFPSLQRIYTPGSKNRLTGQMREVKDRTTDLTKASATPQTKKRLPPRRRRPIYRRLLQAIWSEQTKVSKRSNTVA